jgi:hypothetical protein
MPNIRELENLVAHDIYDPAIDTSVLIDDGQNLMKTYWSSTSWRPMASEAWVVHFDDGDIGASTKSSGTFMRNVRCVRDP